MQGKKVKQIFIQDWLYTAQTGCEHLEFENYMDNKVEEWSVLKHKLSLIQ
jgi:hypothetical protein